MAVNCKDVTRVASWNVRTLTNRGKEKILMHQLEKYKITIAALSEVRWIGKGIKSWGEYTMVYSGEEKLKQHGVAIVMNKRAVRAWEAAEKECVQGDYRLM